MGEVILKIENVSKRYQLGTFGTRTIGGDVHRWWTTKVLGKEDPFLQVGSINDRTSKEKADFVWALKDINFEVKRGEVLGIIGKNGAGKSTLLKLLSRVTTPTTGSIKSMGRMASLLEVGTGFHPELTGLENIYLNGAILGMTKAEIRQKLDEIIDFSGCALYIDTPVKRYSSGMKVRLGFAVAAFLDPEILVVDEVLAVGDAEFQKKAIGKMKDVSVGEGRTVLFVSHNLNSVSQLCNSGLVLVNGETAFYGNVNDSIKFYQGTHNTHILTDSYNALEQTSELIFLNKAITISSSSNEPTRNFSVNESIIIDLEFIKISAITGIYLHLMIKDEGENLIIETDSYEHEINVFDTSQTGQINARVFLPPRILKGGRFFISLGLASDKAPNRQIQVLENFLSFEVIADEYPRDIKRRAFTSAIPKVDYIFLEN